MTAKPLVAVVMGSSSDWETMQHAVEVLERFNVPHERHIVSAHRTPVWMAEFANKYVTSPPKREWVGLTDEDMKEIFIYAGDTAKRVARAIEAKLKEKNNAI